MTTPGSVRAVRVGLALAWSAMVLALGVIAVTVTGSSFSFEVSSGRSAEQREALVIVLLVCCGLAAAAWFAHGYFGSRTAAVLVAVVAGLLALAALLNTGLALLLIAGVGCWVLLAAAVAVVVRSVRPPVGR